MSERITTNEEIVVRRILDVPIEDAWRSWTDPERVMQWWGPDGFSSPSARIDFREGGTSIVCMRSPAGQEYYSTWEYRAILHLQRIEYLQNLSDRDGHRVDPVALGLPASFPRDVRTVVTFKAMGAGATEVTVEEYGFVGNVMYEMALLGLNQCLDKLSASLKRERIRPSP